MEELSNPPVTSEATGFEAEGVTPIFFEGLRHEGKPTRVFAWVGIPPNGSEEARVPGMVLLHGGGGTAFDRWVRLWKDRGYAAIAMDTCGCVPRGTYGHWERDERGGPPGWGGFDQIDATERDQWTFHAVADAILAHSLLRSLPEVDPDRIGLTGISWGGYLACIVAGVDARFSCVVPVYGCGFLGEDSAWLNVLEKMGESRADKWLSLWDPSVYLPSAKMPMLWVTGTNDFAYPMGSLQRSYRLFRGKRTLCLRVRMPHGHGDAGEKPEEIRAFVDALFLRGEPLVRVTGQGRKGRMAWARFSPPLVVTRAELNFTEDSGRWQDREWRTIPCRLKHGARKASCELPERTTVYYVNLIDHRGLVVSTEHEEIAPGDAMLHSKGAE